MLSECLYHLSNLHRRLLVVFFAITGPRWAYAMTAWLARRMYRALEPVRLRSEAQCRAALSGVVPADRVCEFAEDAFVHRALDFTDLYLADRLLHPGTFHRFGGAIPPMELHRMLDAQRRGQPAVLLTAYYGPFDLLPLLLGFNGVRCSAVYLAHKNPDFDAYRKRIRGRSGTELILAEHAAAQFPDILEKGGSIAIVADHHAGRKGLPVTFLGLPTRAMRTVGLLAWRYNADVAVAGIRRVGLQFKFEVVVEDVIDHTHWADQPDPITYITQRYLRALERIILRDPSQYLWAYHRWGKELIEQLQRGERPTNQTNPPANDQPKC